MDTHDHEIMHSSPAVCLVFCKLHGIHWFARNNMRWGREPDMKPYIIPYYFISSAWIRQSAELDMVWSLCLSSVSQLSQNLLSRFLSYFSCGFRWAIAPDIFWIFEKKWIFKFFRIFFFVFLLTMLTWDPNGSQNFKTRTPPSNHFWILSNFLWIFFSVSWQKNCFGFLKFCVFDFSRIFFFANLKFTIV